MRLTLLLLLSILPTAWAGTIFDNGLPITDPNLDCRSSCPVLTLSVGSGIFVLDSEATISGVQFYTFQVPGAYKGGTLDWAMYTDNSGVQGSLLESGSFLLSQTELDNDISVASYGPLIEYENDFTIHNLLVNPSPAPQNYFLDITDMNGGDGFGIFWATSGPNTLAFQLDGTVSSDSIATPEPAVPYLLIIGMVSALAYRTWPRKRTSI
jgi:hypothetical protein